MDQYQETFETWNKLAIAYQNKFMHLNLYNETYDFICRAITHQNPTILEIGCGPGNITQYLLTKRPDFIIDGIDIAPNMIELAKKNNPTASFTIMDVRQIHTIQSKYDAIVSGFCLPYLSPTDGEKLIQDCYQLLHPNGLLYISFVEGNPQQSHFQTTSEGYRSYFYYHLLEDVQQCLLNNQFHQQQMYKVEYATAKDTIDTHTIIIASKKE